MPVPPFAQLMAVFRDFAPVVEARVVRDRATSVSRGFGFVEFQSVEVGPPRNDTVLDGW